jgi:hypothetical protein
MINCQVSEKLKIGPVIPHTIITDIAIKNAAGEPVALVTAVENLSKTLLKPFLFGLAFFIFFYLSVKERTIAFIITDR